MEKPSGSRSEIRSEKAFVEDWVFVSGDSSDGQTVMDFPVLHSTDHSDCTPETPRISKHFHYGHGPNSTSFIHDNSVPFLSVWNCHFQMMKSCPVTKNLTPQEQIYVLRGSR